ncbi:MAG TPA: glucose-6-phosphate dehydrogenase [Terrimesophilobacter sp.]|nr:glucose-6-phosphate dehydrogenase [Terrimesophilobacter sp.]HRP99113.1 glucose-6-phosphate dehydrogenase [Terrimesophilobacter sp.]
MTKTTALLILGASGDLTSRLLLPALGQLLHQEPGRRIRLLGAGSDPLSADQWSERIASAFSSSGAVAELSQVEHSTYTQADVTDADSLRRLIEAAGGPLVIYFALPPTVTHRCCEVLSGVELPAGTVLALEKPFGSDVSSARKLNELLLTLVPEERIFRVDLFLAFPTLLNILDVRFANRVFARVWNAENVESVTIRFDESLALEGRARYYDRAGALVDMVQSHLLQVLALVAMEPPESSDAEHFRLAVTEVLRATRVWGGDPVAASRRARYTAGNVGSRPVASYVDEPGVDASRHTETFTELVCEVQTERWAGVPFRLRSGKALEAKRSTVSLQFKPVRQLAEGLSSSESDGGQLTFSVDPDELLLELNLRGGSDPDELVRETLTAGVGDGRLLAYSKVLSGILDGDLKLSVRADAVEECWRIVESVREAWARGDVPMEEYEAGSLGPLR